jgi:hypothetical protein
MQYVFFLFVVATTKQASSFPTTNKGADRAVPADLSKIQIAVDKQGEQLLALLNALDLLQYFFFVDCGFKLRQAQVCSFIIPKAQGSLKCGT